MLDRQIRIVVDDSVMERASLTIHQGNLYIEFEADDIPKLGFNLIDAGLIPTYLEVQDCTCWADATPGADLKCPRHASND